MAASWMWEPEEMVARGEMRTLSSRVVGVGVAGVVEVVDVDVDVGAGPPIVDFSPTIHPFPITMGPS